MISKISLFGLPMNSAMIMTKKAGFDGIEILINHWYRWRIPYYRILAQKFGLKIHFHQAWSPSEDPSDFTFKILSLAGYLPKNGYKLKGHIPSIITEPVVIQADRSDESVGHSNYWLQTDFVFDPNKKNEIRIREFTVRAIESKSKIVFDTHHYLEMRFHTRGVENIPIKKEILLSSLIRGWEYLNDILPIEEIHLNDFNSSERNVFTGDGVVPLKEFCKFVKESGWSGTIVPEISPKYLFPYSTAKLIELRERVEYLFS